MQITLNLESVGHFLLVLAGIVLLVILCVAAVKLVKTLKSVNSIISKMSTWYPRQYRTRPGKLIIS